MNAAKSPAGSSRENDTLFVLALTGRGNMATVFEKIQLFFTIR
jgi:hypothetical protein